ncbi:MAG: hypothetical protein P4L59_20095 [Desulfosporosinus sp.]|nr:hypothetical protein [Desulfosporosinus sp.]
MPRISRIRIINFSYNNDSRHIQDETFNFHGGENALLSLANGGGRGKKCPGSAVISTHRPGNKNPRAAHQRFFSQEALTGLCPDRMEVGWGRGLFSDGYRDGVG